MVPSLEALAHINNNKVLRWYACSALLAAQHGNFVTAPQPVRRAGRNSVVCSNAQRKWMIVHIA